MSLVRANKDVLELMARNRPIDEILEGVVRLVETFAPGCLSTICFVIDGKLRLGAAPSWPPRFRELVDGCPIGPAHGICGTSAYRGERIISTDVSKDECWGPYRDTIMSFGVRAAWAAPVLSEERVVLATVNMCWKELRAPTDWEFEIVDVATRLIALAVERKRHEELIAEQEVRLAAHARLAAIGEMSANLAHEINNPLAILQMHASHLRAAIDSGRFSPEAARATINEIDGTITRISRVIKGLRAISRDAEQDPLEPVELGQLVDEALSICRERFRKHGVELEATHKSPGLCVKARPAQIAQVLLNLLGNAFDAVVSLSDKWVRVEVAEIDGEAVISVIDSGPGIPGTLHQRIMQPFFTTKAASYGTGLGLSISRKLVETHHGRLELNCSAGHTQFDVKLPRFEGAAFGPTAHA